MTARRRTTARWAEWNAPTAVAGTAQSLKVTTMAVATTAPRFTGVRLNRKNLKNRSDKK